MAVQMTRSNEIPGSMAARLVDMLLPRPSSTFLIRNASSSGDILVVDRAVPPSEGRRAVMYTDRGLKLATLRAGFNPAEVWGVVTCVIREPS